MRLALTVVASERGRIADVVVEADPDAPVSDLAAELAELMRDGTGARTRAGTASAHPSGQPAVSSPTVAVPLYVDGQLIDPSLSVAGSPLRPGCVVSLADASGCLPAEACGVAEIRVVSGPAAGAIHRLPSGAAEVGSGSHALAWVPDPKIPASALRVTVDGTGECKVAPIGDVAATLEREPLTEEVPWLPRQQVTVGGSLLELAISQPPDAALTPSEDGAGQDFNRSPRQLHPVSEIKLAIDDDPARDQGRLLTLLSGAAPVGAGVVMGALSHDWAWAAMSVLGPVPMIVNNVVNRKHGIKSYAQKVAEHARHRARVEKQAREALETERDHRRESSPDAATVLAIATGPRARLWERLRTHPDYLLLRVGTADLPSKVELHDPNADEHSGGPVLPIPDCPVTIPLRELGVLGVAGPGDTPRQIGSWLVAQAATLHSPNDLRVYLLIDRDAREGAQAAWEWVRWLPHCKQLGASGVALIGNDDVSRDARIGELDNLIQARLKLRDGRSADVGPPDVLVVLDGSRGLGAKVGRILADGPKVGVYAICLDSEHRHLPDECHAWTLVEGYGLRVMYRSGATIKGVRPEFVRPGWCMRLARGVSPVRLITKKKDDVGLPDSSRLLDLFDLEPPSIEKIVGRWKAGGSTTVRIGEGVDGPFEFDLRRDGPHGLIAGTTGSGKSELLQTIVAALALVNRPEDMTFALIDYKGGATFKECEQLPHTVGVVTDLDAYLVGRALSSLSAELTRREHMLDEAGAKNIEDYARQRNRARQSGIELPGPMPRLLIIIDEFASMARELPEYVTELVNIAQRGRTLGIHLILATQRPSGVVSADIAANTNLRIAMRVVDQSDSADVIHAPDAAYIAETIPGRGYLRVGHGKLEPFQASRVGGPRPRAETTMSKRVWAAQLGWSDVGRAEPYPPGARKGGDEELTDLRVLVNAIGQASRQLNDDEVYEPPHPPWLPPLPEHVTLDLLPISSAAAPGEVPLLPFGLTDVPARQTRESMVLDLAHGGHVVVAGAAHSGRSTVLRTIAGSVAQYASPADVHIYALDCSTGALQSLESLPHCGAVISRGDTDRVERLIAKMEGEIARRRMVLARGGFAGVAEQRARIGEADKRLPWMVLLLDWWEGFHAAYEKYDYGHLIDRFLQLLREGAGVGLRAVVTTDRLALTGQTGTVFERRMLLRLTDPGDSALAGISERSLPARQPAGRIVIEGTPEPLEVQVALLDHDSSGPAQVAALRRLGEASLARFGQPEGARRPLRVDPLPTGITLEEAWRLAPGFVPPSPLWALVGVGGDEVRPVGLDIRDDGPGLTVAGPRRSGRSTTLVTMATSLLAWGTPVLVLTPRRSPLRFLDGRPGVIGILGPDASADDLTAAVSHLESYAIIVDDAELLSNGPLSAPLEKILVSGRDGEHGLIIAGTTGDLARAFSGFVKETLKSRSGVLVGVEAATDGDLFGIRLPRNAGRGPKGRGLLVRAGTATSAQLAVTE